ncbi:MAG: 30S ribosomal protein S4 [Candidatus Omnitrophica bacterium]|nr:30S ribosomal protein S4 [Candidatus Omnitrophota bacterium]
MARVTGASCRQCRREGEKLFLKGPRCTSSSCAFMRREYAPGQHGQARRRKASGYATQLREKQKAKRIYGVLEKQFRNYFVRAEKDKGATGEVLLQLLERRLDNVIFRACFTFSRPSARQLVGHGFVRVNGRRVDIPSYTVKTGDEITVTGTDAQLKSIRENAKLAEDRGTPEWIEASGEKLVVKVVRLPKKSDIGMVIEENLIVELYSK